MPTERLYYDNTYLTECTAKVLQTTERADGAFDIVLDCTVLYPEGGGQPCDTGWIDDVPVSLVREEDGYIIHTSSMKPSRNEVRVKLDWKKRVDHMQQHTGQHILSGAFYKLYGMNTVSFHMGTNVSHIDINAAQLAAETIVAVERLANEIVSSNKPVLCSFKTEAEIQDIAMRKGVVKAVQDIRIVDIAGFDICPCGGTHVDRTGSIGMIKVVGTERKNKAVRVYFVCGTRALQTFQLYYHVIDSLGSKLTAPPEKMLAAYDKQLEKIDKLDKELSEKSAKLYEYIASDLCREARKINGREVVAAKVDGLVPQELSNLAKKVTEQERTVFIGASCLPEDKVHFIFSRHADVALPMNEILKQILPLVGGKGGGSAQTAQGGCVGTDKLDEALASVLKILNIEDKY